MNTFGLMLAVCGGLALLALVTSLTANVRLARRLARASLWVTLGAMPLALGVDVVRMWLDGGGAYTEAFSLGRTISHVMNYGVVALPCAGIAMLALRRASTVRLK